MSGADLHPGMRVVHYTVREQELPCTVVRVGEPDHIGGVTFHDALVRGDDGREWWAPVRALRPVRREAAA